jgi:hypothetical protein
MQTQVFPVHWKPYWHCCIIVPHTHPPALHALACSGEHCWQKPPSMPQLFTVPGMKHWPPWQQPPGQDAPLQATVMQVPETQDCPPLHAAVPASPQTHCPVGRQVSATAPLHAVQAFPLAPHSAKTGGEKQVLPEQHPLHEPPVQTQAPPWQTRPTPQGVPASPQTQLPFAAQVSDLAPLQLTQLAPPTPQKWRLSGLVQVWLFPLPLQHPTRQELGSQTQTPAEQWVPAEQTLPVFPHSHCPVGEQVSESGGAQLLQVAPPTPQDPAFGDVVQTEPVQQPPAQELPLHWQTPPTHWVPRPQGAPLPHSQLPPSQLLAVFGSHAEQRLPPAPHALNPETVLHPPSAVQHPAQDSASHTHCPPLQRWPLVQIVP